MSIQIQITILIRTDQIIMNDRSIYSFSSTAGSRACEDVWIC